jgi:hypothetical protein
MANRAERSRYVELAEKTGVPLQDVIRIVESYFRDISSYASRLPFNTPRRIFLKEKFDEYVRVDNIPFLGRIGPVYSRYLQWRTNESKGIDYDYRKDRRVKFSKGEIENIAKEALSGGTPDLKEHKNSELFDRVWVVGKNGKKSARQIIPKEPEQ